MLRKVLRRPVSRIRKFTNSLGNSKKCYVCGASFDHFAKFGKGSKGINNFRRRLNMVGSDVDNFRCMYCGCNDRERHLFMYFDKLELWQQMQHSQILHFAPEKHLPTRIIQLSPLNYVKADLYPASADIRKIDATSIPFDDATFDLLIANHILEHIPDYTKALFEFYRVLKVGGCAILQTPYSILLLNNFEDPGINTDDQRLFFHGQVDHVRTFGFRQFVTSLETVGFKLQIKHHADYFDDRVTTYYGVNKREDLIMAVKPATP